MGNCVSQGGQKEFLKSLRTSCFIFVSFQIFNDNKSLKNFFMIFIHFAGVLKVTDREILWPFLYLRRYGFTSGGVFFFESGRRCSTGEGLHTFQTYQSEVIFQDSASVNSAASDLARQSIVDNLRNACLYRTGRVPANSRIHPLQRYFSEGVVFDSLATSFVTYGASF
ncbi:unnamed protein product [Enterobius vermicularis]|uniref:IRS-type PTB domain-containing protein n=1 Tax=Enterobius vermicularis TaxID=51028 RepID=A0A0N4VIQ8_ENTVE|nr:unnamed protein product [Enterobius vermicularis]